MFLHKMLQRIASANFQAPHKATAHHGFGRGRKLRIESLEDRQLLSVTPLGSEFRVNTYTEGTQRTHDRNPRAIAMDVAGNYVITWSSYYQDNSGTGVYAQRYDATGMPQGSEFRVNTYTTGTQRHPTVAMDSDGDFLITWSSYHDGNGSGVYAQRFNSTGVPQGSEFRVSTYTTGNTVFPVVAMDTDGDFVITWSSEDQDGWDYGVYAQRFNAAGTPQGSEFRVNTYTTGTQNPSSAAMDADGNFVISWTSITNSAGINDGEVIAQRYNSAGVPQGSEIRVNTYPTSYQRYSTVVMDADGDFVITWSSFGQDGSWYGVYAQRFNAMGVALGSEFRVNTYTTGSQQSSAVDIGPDGDFVVTWSSYYQDGHEFGVFARYYDAEGVPQGSEFQVNSYTTGWQITPSVALDSNSDFVIVWASGDDVYARRFDESNDSAAPRVTNVYAASATGVSKASPIAQNEREVSAIPKLVVSFTEAMATTGPANVNSALNWRLERNGVDVSSQISNISFGFNSSTARYEALLSLTTPLGDGAYELTARSSLTDVAGNRLDGNSDGSGFTEDYVHRFSIAQSVAAGSEFRVNSYTTGDQLLFSVGNGAVAVGANGDFVVTWGSNNQDGSSYGVYAQRYNAAGVALGSEFRVNNTTFSAQYYPSIAMADNGGFVITWHSEHQDGDQAGVYARRFDASGVAQGSEFRVNSYTTGYQRRPRIGMDSDGDFVIAWVNYESRDGSGYGIYAQRYNASGVAQGTEFRVNTYTNSDQMYPVIGMDAGGNFVIAWRSYGQDGDDAGVFAQRYDAQGALLGNEFRVNSYTTNSQTQPDIAMIANGDFFITWESAGQDGAPGDATGFGIYGQRYNAAGVPLGTEFLINTITAGSQTLHETSMDDDGDFVVVWDNEDLAGSVRDVSAQRFNSLGVPQGSQFTINTYTTGLQRFPAVAMDSDGDFVAVWQAADQDGSGWGIYAQRYAATARVDDVRVSGDTTAIVPGERLLQTIPAGGSLAVTFSQPMSQTGGSSGGNSVTNPANWFLTKNGVNISSQITGVNVSGAMATLTLSSALGSGNYQLTTTSAIHDLDGRALDGDSDGSPGGNFTRAFSIDPHVQAGNEFQVNTYTTDVQTSPTIGIDAAGNFVIIWMTTWQDGTVHSVMGQLYAADGTPRGSEFRVHSYTTSSQAEAVVAMNAHGDFVVTWRSSLQDGDAYGAYAQRFSAAGVPQGSEFQVNTYTTGKQHKSSVAIDDDGDFVITWANEYADGRQHDIIGQRFNSSGVRQGTEFRVNSYTTGQQYLPSIAMDAVGNFVITWFSNLQEGAGYEVYAQRYSASGVALGGEFRVNTTTTNNQRVPRIAMSPSGDHVITWTSTNQDGDTLGVYAQRYSAAGVPQGSEFRVNTYTTGFQRLSHVSMDADGDFVIAWDSDQQDGSGWGVYAQRYSATGVPQGGEFLVNITTTLNQADSPVALDADGDMVFAWSSFNQDGDDYGVFARRFSGTPTLQVTSMTSTYSGFEVEFNREFDPSLLNLHDQSAGFGAADVTLTGTTVGAVRGSVVLDPSSRKLTFVKSGGPLTLDTYTISLRSSGTGFVDLVGSLLDGNGDGLTADNYTASFTITPPTGVTLSVGDVTRGYGQSVNLPASTSAGIPITISNAVGVKSASFALSYDPALLTITGATAGAGIAGAVSLDTSVAGIAQITITSASQLSATPGLQTLVHLTATVPSSAPYGSKQVLDLASVQLLDTSNVAIPAVDDDGIHIAAYFGDANGSQTYNAPDATLVQRIIVGSGSLLPAFPLADPYLLIDINGNSQVQSDDVTQIQRAIVGLSTSDIPALPGLATVVSAGPDPIISIPQNLAASVGQTITVPVELLVTEPTGIVLVGADLAIAYDAARLELDEVQLGELLVGFGMNVNLATPGVIRISMTASSPLALPFDDGGVLAELNFKVLTGSGPTRVNLLGNAESLQTALYDDFGRSLLLQPAPTNDDDDSIDGLIDILATDQVLGITR